jgi:hypothetical protein
MICGAQDGKNLIVFDMDFVIQVNESFGNGM